VSAPKDGSYGRGARLLSIGIASTGLVTFSYFALASHVLGEDPYGRISLLWAVMFVIVSVIYRPIEQLLSREIASGRGAGVTRVAMTLQGGFAVAFVVLALALRGPIEDDLFDGESSLYWILVAGVLFYAASYFARGWLAGHQRFGLYGGLVFMEATSRFLFALAVAVGIATGQDAVALGMAAAPLVSLVVVPWAFSRGAVMAEATEETIALGRGGRFAGSVFAVQLAEQTLVNAAVLVASAASGAAVAGFVFNAMLITRAPLQLFQAIQGSLLPHLSKLTATGSGEAEFRHAVRLTVLAIGGFALAVAAGLLAIGPWAMDLLFEDDYTYARGGLALVALGMGAHLIAGTLNQAALARDHAGAAAAAWLVAAAVFVAWMVLDVIDDLVLRTEVGYLGSAALLCALLTAIYLRPPGREARSRPVEGGTTAAG
jgi:O-antigen/teichoic acid export membrane protein